MYIIFLSQYLPLENYYHDLHKLCAAPVPGSSSLSLYRCIPASLFNSIVQLNSLKRIPQQNQQTIWAVVYKYTGRFKIYSPW